MTWTATSLANAATHELGRVLGLDHSSKGGLVPAMMWPTVTNRTTLDEDDIIAGNSMYNTWEQMPGAATDIGANTLAGLGADGDSLWILGRTSHSDGFSAFEWTGAWTERTGARGIRIDVDNTGKAWMIGKNNRVFRWSGTSWSEVPGGGLGTDIGIGAGGQVFIIGMDGNAWSLASSGSGWNSAGGPGNAVAINVDVWGVPWVLKSNQQLWSRSGANGSWIPPRSSRRVAR